MRVLIGMETSGKMRDAFLRRGHEAISADLLPHQHGGPHHEGDLFAFLASDSAFDFAIFHPTCTFHTVSSAWAFKDADFERYPGVGYHQRVQAGTKTGAERRAAREEAEADFERLRLLPFLKLIENPKGTIPSRLGHRPVQTVQPYEFGADASKGTCFWIFDADGQPRPDLAVPVDPRMWKAGRMVEWPKGSGKMVERWANQTDSGQNNLTPGDARWQVRSNTYDGIAEAVAEHFSAAVPLEQWGDFV